MSTLDESITNLEKMRDELMKASFTKDNYNSSWGQTLEMISNGLNNYARVLKRNKFDFGDFDHV